MKSMYKIPERTATRISRNEATEGEPIERQIERLINNKDTKFSTKEIMYTRPEQGVVYGTDIRGDKWDKAIEMTEKVTENVRNARQKKYDERKKILEDEKERKSDPEGKTKAERAAESGESNSSVGSGQSTD